MSYSDFAIESIDDNSMLGFQLMRDKEVNEFPFGTDAIETNVETTTLETIISKLISILNRNSINTLKGETIYRETCL